MLQPWRLGAAPWRRGGFILGGAGHDSLTKSTTFATTVSTLWPTLASVYKYIPNERFRRELQDKL